MCSRYTIAYIFYISQTIVALKSASLSIIQMNSLRFVADLIVKQYRLFGKKKVLWFVVHFIWIYIVWCMRSKRSNHHKTIRNRNSIVIDLVSMDGNMPDRFWCNDLLLFPIKSSYLHSTYFKRNIILNKINVSL